MDVRMLRRAPHAGNRSGAELPPRVFDSDLAPADDEVLAHLRAGVADADLAASPVVLPDFHHKSDMEMPSSAAVATLHTIRPTFTSASVNCGMALLALDIEAPGSDGASAFLAAVRRRYPHPPANRAELTANEVIRAAHEGAAFAVDRYGLDPGALERIETLGRVDLEPYGGVGRLRHEIPWFSMQLSRMRFGTIGPSNHFVEIQRVEEVIEPRAAERLGVHEGQVTIQYHAGGGMLTGQVGRLFVPRKKMSRPMKAVMLGLKPAYHLGRARSVAQLRERLALYFRDGIPAVPRASDEGDRLMLVNAAAMNYGFAFRGATYAFLARTAASALGARRVELVVDSPHNSIYEEALDGGTAIVHRHNACRAFPASRMPAGTAFADVGQALLLPGTHRTSSYLCVADEGAAASLFSACHGAGTMISDLERRGITRADPRGRTTLRFRYGTAAGVPVPQLDDRGVDEAVSILAGNGIVRRVARLRPIAVLH
jgi:tRNA-splicing ligase RtcB